MEHNADIWTAATRNIETFAQQMSATTFGFFLHGLYILGLALILCRLTSRGRATSPALNWLWIVIAFVLGSKIPMLMPESATAKVLLLIASTACIVLVPARLSVYLSGNERQRGRIQFFLVGLLVIVFAVDQFVRRSP